MLKFEFTFFIISLKYLGPASEFLAVSSFSNKLIYFSYWLEIEFDFPQSHFCLPLESSRERTLISRKRAAWKRSMEGPATERGPQWFPEEGCTGKHTSVVFLHFLSWSSPDRECPWEDFGERALSLCYNVSTHHFPPVWGRKPSGCIWNGHTFYSQQQGNLRMRRKKGSHTKALIKALKLSVSWIKRFSRMSPIIRHISWPKS